MFALTPLILALAALAPPAPGELALFSGTAGSPGDVETVDEAGALGGQPVAGLTGVVLLNLDFTGRTDVTRLFPDRPRRHALPGTAARLALQGQRGSLYKFSRGGAAFGFFLVDPQGAVRVVWERPGAGPAQDQDPFIERIAVAPSGDSFLVATTLAAGGDLIEVDLATGGAVDRTASLPPQHFGGAGIALHDAWGIGVGTSNVWRFDRATAGDAQAVAFPPAGPPPYLARQLVLSASGTFAATIAGASAALADVYVFAPSGPATRVSQTPGPLSGAGFLPDAEGGPTLFVSDDGVLAGWRREEEQSHEIYLACQQPLPGQVLEFHLTNAPDFDDTGTEAGVLPPLAVAGPTMYMSWGEQGTDPGGPYIEQADVFRVELPIGATAPTFTNVTGTSGVPTPPFDTLGTINPATMQWIPDAGRFFVFDEQSGGGGRILAVDPAGGLQVLLPLVRDVAMVDRVGDHIVFVAQRDFDPRPLETYRVPADLSGAPVLLLTRPDNDEPLRYAVRPDGRLGIVFPDPLGALETMWRIHVPNGVAKLFLRRHLRYGTTIGFAPGGALAATVGVEGFLVTFVSWNFGSVPMRLFPVRRVGFLLPGI